jgi:hypothetical protein
MLVECCRLMRDLRNRGLIRTTAIRPPPSGLSLAFVRRKISPRIGERLAWPDGAVQFRSRT